MRVIAGRFRGRRLEAPRGSTTRPVTDRVKESIFNILGSLLGTPGAIPAIEVLDVFAGSGAMGIECLSRGAGSCVFVEQDRRALRVLRANLATFGLSETYRVLCENAWTMRVPRAASGAFGLMFVDPPYRDVDNPIRVLDLLERLASNLTREGLIVLRHAARTHLPEREIRGLTCVDTRAFGTMCVRLLRHPTAATQVSRDSTHSG